MVLTPAIIADRYILQDVLGKGGTAVVYKCLDTLTKRLYAAKIFQNYEMSKLDSVKFETEARICKILIHPGVVRLHRVIQEEKVQVLIFDLITEGELFDDLVTRKGKYTEELAAKCMFQLFEIVKYCHKMGVVHRDLKPENILLESKENKIIKLADFGSAVEVLDDQEKQFGITGTLNYMAPEVLEMKPYGKPVDCWACGVIMYILLAGKQPFDHPNERKLETLIIEGDYELGSRCWKNVTDEGKNLLQRLLCVVPGRRLTAAQALLHPWFVKVKSSNEPLSHCANKLETLKEFNEKRKLKATTCLTKTQHYVTAKRRNNRTNTTNTSRSSLFV